MQYFDIPSISSIKSLARFRGSGCVSIALRATPVTQDVQMARIAFGNLASDALAQVGDDGLSTAAKRNLESNLADIAEDDDFWQFQSESLVVFATPDKVRTFRLPNHLTDDVQVSDRFHLSPLLRAVAFPHGAIILVLARGSVRVVEMIGNLPAGEVRIPGMPDSAASVAGKASISGRSPKGRLQGSEGQKVHLLAYSRRIDEAMRPYLAGREEPVIVVANEPLRSIFLSVCSIDNIIDGQPTGVREDSPNLEIAAAARELLDSAYASEVQAFLATYASEAARRRATSKVSDIARSSTFGGVDTLLINMDANLPGIIDEEDGGVRHEDDGAASYDILSEIACRTLLTGGSVFSVRQDDLPGPEPLAAILRHPV